MRPILTGATYLAIFFSCSAEQVFDYSMLQTESGLRRVIQDVLPELHCRYYHFVEDEVTFGYFSTDDYGKHFFVFGGDDMTIEVLSKSRIVDKDSVFFPVSAAVRNRMSKAPSPLGRESETADGSPVSSVEIGAWFRKADIENSSLTFGFDGGSFVVHWQKPGKPVIRFVEEGAEVKDDKRGQ